MSCGAFYDEISFSSQNTVAFSKLDNYCREKWEKYSENADQNILDPLIKVCFSAGLIWHKQSGT